jgi:hypothetical protein
MINRVHKFSFAKPKSIYRLGDPVAALREKTHLENQQQAHPTSHASSFVGWRLRHHKPVVR